MIVSFDSLNRFEDPQIIVCNPGCRYADNKTLTSISGYLHAYSDVEILFNFNAVSELNLRVYDVKYEDADQTENAHRLYRSLKNKRLLFVDGNKNDLTAEEVLAGKRREIGFFVITGVTEGYGEDGIAYKDIRAESCETEIQSKNLPYIEDGTYPFDDLLDTIISVLPGWEKGTVSPRVASLHRTFEDIADDLNCLGFMVENMQDAYECIFVFDIVKRVINVYDQNNYVVDTSIHLTKDDIINSITIEESSDDLYTAISVFGQDELSVNAINPLGTATIYNFDYYLEWMSASLGERVKRWQDLVKSYSVSEYTTAYVVPGAEEFTSGWLSLEEGGSPVVPDSTVIYEIASGAREGETYGWNTESELYQERSSYYRLQLSFYDHMTQMSGYKADKQMYETQLAQYQRCRENIVAEPSDADSTETLTEFTQAMIDTYNQALEQIGVTEEELIHYRDESGNIKDKSAVVASLNMLSAGIQGSLNAVNQNIAELSVIMYGPGGTEEEPTPGGEAYEILEIHNEVAITEYFTQTEYDELFNYIFEGTYTDEYIIVTDLMTQAERFGQMKTLYDRAVIQLEKISQPTQEFDVDVESFIFEKEFEEWSDQLETGCLINVELEENDIAMLFLSTIEVNYEDRTLKLTFGNRFNKYDPRSLYDDVLGRIKRNANTLNYLKTILFPVKNGFGNAVREALEDSRNLTKDTVILSKNQQVLIDDTGYTGRKLMPDGTFDPHQVKINNNNIVFTDDAWDTCTTAIGELVFQDGTTGYGINTNLLLGDIILGNQLHITDGENDLLSVMNDINAGYEDLQTDIAINQAGIQANFDSISDMRSYINVGAVGYDESGKEIIGVKIGKSDGEGSDFSSVFTSEELGFYDSGDKTAFLSNKKLNVETTRTGTIQLSNNLSDAKDSKWQMGIDSETNAFYLKWIG